MKLLKYIFHFMNNLSLTTLAVAVGLSGCGNFSSSWTQRVVANTQDSVNTLFHKLPSGISTCEEWFPNDKWLKTLVVWEDTYCFVWQKVIVTRGSQWSGKLWELSDFGAMFDDDLRVNGLTGKSPSPSSSGASSPQIPMIDVSRKSN